MTPRRYLRTRFFHRQRGQSATEFLIVAPILLFLVLGIVQMVLLYRAKTTLDYAALQAARAGAVNGALVSEMRRGLKEGLIPLYATRSGLEGVAEARLRMEGDFLLHRPRIEIISPTQAAWQEHQERQYDGRMALPNDSLAFRSQTVGGSGVNVQDANILKIKVTYDYPLIVPFVDWVLAGLSELIRSDNLIPATELTPENGLIVNRGRVTGGPKFRLPLQSTAIVRMQSPIHRNPDLPR